MRKKANNTSTNNLVDKLINFMLVLNCIETFQIFDSLAVNSQVEMYFFNIFFYDILQNVKIFQRSPTYLSIRSTKYYQM